MSFYPPGINERLRIPRCAGECVASNAAGTSASLVCGAFTRINLTIDTGSISVSEAKFRSNGCGYMVAVADVLCEWLTNKPLGDLHGLGESDLLELLERYLEIFPYERQQCASVVFDALRAAMATHMRDRINEFRGEVALICTCFGVTEETIINVIAAGGLTDVDDVADVCRAGSGCGSCRMLIQELLDSSKV